MTWEQLLLGLLVFSVCWYLIWQTLTRDLAEKDDDDNDFPM